MKTSVPSVFHIFFKKCQKITHLEMVQKSVFISQKGSQFHDNLVPDVGCNSISGYLDCPQMSYFWTQSARKVEFLMTFVCQLDH